MALRLLEIYLPAGTQESLFQLTKERGPMSLWQQELPDNRLLYRLLVSTEMVEPILDDLQKQFSSTVGFRVLVLTVEATVPQPTHEEGKTTPGAATDSAHPAWSLRRISREEIRAAVEDGATVSWTFTVLVLLSTLVVVIGILANSAAVVIGGMVIAPLLGPNVALAFATTLGDLDLARRALRALALGIGLAAGLSFLVGWFVPVDPSIPELTLRTRVGFGEILVALAVGCAASLSFTTKLSSTVIGVMVAVALLPPISAMGLFLGSGHIPQAIRSVLLILVNLIGINLAGVVTFFTQGIRPLRWWEAERAGKSMRIAIMLWSILLLSLSLIVYLSRA